MHNFHSQLEALAGDRNRELRRTRIHHGPRRQTIFSRLGGHKGPTI